MAVDLKIGELLIQIGGVPEQHVIEELSANRSNQRLHERMRLWNMRDAFDLIDLQDAQVRFPSLLLEPRIVPGAQIRRQRCF